MVGFSLDGANASAGKKMDFTVVRVVRVHLPLFFQISITGPPEKR